MFVVGMKNEIGGRRGPHTMTSLIAYKNFLRCPQRSLTAYKSMVGANFLRYQNLMDNKVNSHVNFMEKKGQNCQNE